jgi:hypothetical protein
MEDVVRAFRRRGEAGVARRWLKGRSAESEGGTFGQDFRINRMGSRKHGGAETRKSEVTWEVNAHMGFFFVRFWAAAVLYGKANDGR